MRLDAFGDETLNIAGAETVSMEDLLRRIRSTRRGTPGPLVRVPLALLRIPLSLAEAIGLGRLLPITAGQLSSFRYDGVGSANRLQAGAELAGVDHMIVWAGPPANGRSPLDVECAAFTRHLLGRDASDNVCVRYRAAHATLSALSPASRFDSFLVWFARLGHPCTTVADAHAALFAPDSLLRKKLVVLLANSSETSSPFSDLIDAPLGGGRPTGAVAQSGLVGLGALVALAVSIPILLPIRLVLALLPRAAR